MHWNMQLPNMIWLEPTSHKPIDMVKYEKNSFLTIIEGWPESEIEEKEKKIMFEIWEINNGMRLKTIFVKKKLLTIYIGKTTKDT